MDTTLFDNQEEAAQYLRELEALGGTEFTTLLLDILSRTPNPQRALIGLHRYLEVALSATEEASLLARSPSYLRLLCMLFSQSQYLTDILCRFPEYAAWLWLDADRSQCCSVKTLLTEFHRTLPSPVTIEAASRAIRRLHKREMLRIATREIVDRVLATESARDLSHLADALLQAALDCATEEVTQRYGIPLRTPNLTDVSSAHAGAADTRGTQRAAFVILGLGKLGGEELNYSSDIDLLFLYEGDGETSGGSAGTVPNTVYFQKLCELVIRLLSEPTADGFAYRVDMRLRPHGRLGPLAVELAQAIEYYSTFGRAWERQALIKARPCAGDIALGEAFLNHVTPFVYLRSFDDETLEDIVSLKAQVEANVAARGKTERDVKLGSGGIRDIEFTVQVLQLLNGGKLPQLRTRNTLETIDALCRAELLSPIEATTLATNYQFLRRVEHRLQIESGRQTHSLPPEGPALDDFARRLGYADGEAFLRYFRERAEDTRRILQRFLATKAAGTLWVEALLQPQAEAAPALQRLKELKFDDPHTAREELLLLAHGDPKQPFPNHVRRRFLEIAPVLIEAVAQTPDPNQTLMRVSQIFMRMQSPGTLYDLLKLNPSLIQYLVTLANNSTYLCHLLERDPGLLDILTNPRTLSAPITREELEQDLAELRRAHEPHLALHRLRDAALLRIAMRDLMGHATVSEVGDSLTFLAEVIVHGALEEILAEHTDRYGARKFPFAVLALGKLGGREMGYGSDLDLVFVYGVQAHDDDSPFYHAEHAAGIASRLIQRLTTMTSHGYLYEVDARLRPDGKKGVLAVSDRRIREYYQTEAQPWERLALMKVRAVTGDTPFAENIAHELRDIAFATPLTPELLDHVEKLRRQLAEGAGPNDLKRDHGGLAEIEFATRLLQLRHVHTLPELKECAVFRALEAMQRHALEPEERCLTLHQAYETLRRVLNRIRLKNGGHSNKLPDAPEEQAHLTEVLRLPVPVLDHITEHKRKVHADYQRLLSELRSLHPTSAHGRES